MSDAYVTSFRLFFRLKRYSIPVLVFSFFEVGYLIYLAWMTSHSSFIALSELADMTFYPLIILLAIDYVYFRKFTDSRTEEALDGMTGGRPVSIMSLFLVRLSVLVMTKLILLLSLFLFSISHDAMNFFRKSSLLISFAYNLFLPAVVFLVIAFALSRTKSRTRPSAFMIVLAIFASPISSFFHTIEPTKMPLDRILDFVMHPFTFLYQGFNRDPHPLYGLQLEAGRLYLMVAFLVLMAAIVIARYAKKQRVLKTVFCLAMAVTLFVVSYMPSSVYRHNLKWNGMYYDLFLYRDASNHLIPWSEVADPNYTVGSYQLDVKTGRELDVTAGMSVESDSDQSVFEFTLYRGYRVKSLSVEHTDSFLWSQTDDTITIEFQEPTRSFDLRLRYKGQSPFYFSNNSACLLPGFFPWYPMAGKKPIFHYYFGEMSNYGYNPLNRVKSASFDVSFAGGKSVLTNLPKVSEGRYQGHANGLSLIAGLIVETNDEKVSGLCFEDEYFIVHHFDLELAIKTLHTEIANAEAKYYDISGKRLSDKGQPYIQVSQLGHPFRMSHVALFDDHILFDRADFILYGVLNQELMQQQNKTASMRSFVDYFKLGYREGLSFYEYLHSRLEWIDNEIEFFQMCIQEGENSESIKQKVEELIAARRDIQQLIQVLKNIEPKEAEKLLYRYSCGDLNIVYKSDAAFLASLMEEGRES